MARVLGSFQTRPKPERGGGWRTESGKTQVSFEHLGRFVDSRCRSLGVGRVWGVTPLLARVWGVLGIGLDWIGLDLIGFD